MIKIAYLLYLKRKDILCFRSANISLVFLSSPDWTTAEQLSGVQNDQLKTSM